jgi:tetratricopeptide (TPR) repeat protein
LLIASIDLSCSIVRYSNRIGELYEDDGNSRSAIYWYERAVLHSRKALKLQNDSAQCKALLSMLYNNLGVAQRRAGLLTDAMNAYDQSIALHPEDDTAHNNKQRLQAELDEWTGSSGKLTPP